jgi:uncharacterized protein YgfB (UPF0149 family)
MTEQLTNAIEEVNRLHMACIGASGDEISKARAELSQAIKDLSRINTLEGAIDA